MQFSAIVAFAFAATAAAKTCGINGALCSKKRSIGMTNYAREWLSAREVPAVAAPVENIEARDAEAIEVQI
ncbi:hypothetical protein P280DRAFT_550803 [Massarina eburnea CBS 473.64]|uniref:Uncharacterized protein n=1 Tax=Massarina eburnea CBS 473.64 TaxID=1395130 RepID=A0A6A6RUX4_9PLEO|nr:hypothetical protein P280DRAFT_550803 [Massarina eburnea CBS 473.64]